MNAYKQVRFPIWLSLIFTFFVATSSSASQITIPWIVDLNIPAISTVPPFDATYNAVDFSPPIGPDRMGLQLASESKHSYTVHLPFEVNISAPDQASPGQLVVLESSAALTGAPYFTTAGNVNFNTKIFADSVSFPLNGFGNTISFGGVSLTVAGDRSYTNTDTSADAKLTRTIWKKDPWGNPLNMPVATRFEGYEMQTTGDLDAWGGSINLLEFASNFIPPPVGTAAAVVSAIVDLSVGPQLDIIENTYLDTQFVTGYYTDDGGATYDDFLINGADRTGYLFIPDTVTLGSTYDIQMTALGLGFSTLFDYLLQGNVDIELEVLSGLYDVDIAEIPLGSSFLVDSWVDRFQYVQFLTDFLSWNDFLASSLSFDIVPGLSNQSPSKTAPSLGMAKIDPLTGMLIDTNADQSQQSFSFPGNPPSATATVTSVSEPSTILLVGAGLLALSGLRRRKNI